MQPKTAFALRYRARNWKDNEYPDGTKVDPNKLTDIPIYGTMFYDDENGTPETIDMRTFNTQIGREVTIDAGVKMISSNSKQRNPGEFIDYNVQVTVGNQSFTDFKQPEITIAIPHMLELVDPHLPKVFHDIKNDRKFEDAVSVELVSSDDNYNYYKFITDNTGYINGGLPSFNIPIQLRIVDGTLSGEYEFGGIFVSRYGGDFLQLSRSVNNASEAMANKYGHTNTDESYKYTYFGGHNADSVSILTETRIRARGAARANSSEQWTDIKGFAVDPNTYPETLSSIVNQGNTRFGTVKLYNILPYDADSNNSTGSIKFTGIETEGNPTVWYTTVDPTTLPAYGGNLQTWDNARLTSLGFTKTAPAMDQVTAVFIDYETAIIEPGKSFDTIMKFHVPDENNQTAFTQFQYSYEELDSTSAPVSPVSDIYMFSTESFSIIYDENLPSFLLEGITAAENIPENQSTMLDVNRDGEIVLTVQDDNKVPTLPGYVFTGWKVQGGTDVYQPGDTVTYVDQTPQIVTLEAQWEEVDSTVKLYKNINVEDDELILTEIHKFGSIVDFTAFADQTRTGYEFKGWSERRSGGTILGNDFRVNFINEKWFYANWDAHTYTIEYDANGGENTMSNQSRKYDDQRELLNNEFSRTGYTFVGWSESTDGSSKVYTENEVANITAENDVTVTLYAVWKANTYTIKLGANGGVGTATSMSKVYDVDKDLPSNPYTKVGYKFEGWFLDADATVATFQDAETITQDFKDAEGAEETLYAVWSPVTYTVKFDLQGGTGTADDTVKTYDKDLNLPNGITKVGYEFKGWATTENAQTAEYTAQLTDDLKTEQDEEITLYAVWTANTYTISFNANGGEGSTTSITKVYEVDQALTENAFTREGYTFTGWTTSPTGAVVYEDGEIVADDLTTEDNEMIVLYAVWSANSYTIDFDANGGIGEIDSITTLYDESIVLPLTTFTRDGYEFMGWSTTATGDVEFNDASTVKNLVTDGSVTLYAVCVENEYEINLDAEDIEIHISDLEKAIASKTLDSEIVKLMNAKGYKLNANGTREELPVFVYNSDALIDAKVDDVLDVTLSLVDPQTERGRSLNPKVTANKDVTVKILGDKTEEKKDPKDPSAGIETLNPALLMFIIASASLLFILLAKKKKQENK